VNRPTCSSCGYWEEDTEEYPSSDRLGFCRRHPPVRFLEDEHNEDRSVYPETIDSDWCGEHPDFPAFLAATRSGAVSPEVGNSHPSPLSPHPAGLTPSSDGSGG
jgi:hypothetical protein